MPSATPAQLPPMLGARSEGGDRHERGGGDGAATCGEMRGVECEMPATHPELMGCFSPTMPSARHLPPAYAMPTAPKSTALEETRRDTRGMDARAAATPILSARSSTEGVLKADT